MLDLRDPEDPKSAALAAIIANVKRLIRDAEMLQQRGSAGSALTLAILAFEEAGKGYIIKHGWEKPKQVRSHHSYRHMLAFLVLRASLIQKYGLDLSEITSKIAQRFADAGVKPWSSSPLPPMTEELREALRGDLLPQFKSLSAEELTVFEIELRWLEKVAVAVQGGKLESIRQSGLYLDTNDELEITSSPMTIENIDAERWIWVSTCVLNLLEGGEYRQPYSPLAEILATARQGNNRAKGVLAVLQERFTSNSSKDAQTDDS